MGLLTNHYPMPTLAVDFDGTLCRDSRGDEPGEVNWVMAELMQRWRQRGWYLVVHSSRPVSHNQPLRLWLIRNRVPFDEVCCGSKPPADLYVDDKGLFPPLQALDALVAWHEHADALQALADGALDGAWAAQQAQVPENPDGRTLWRPAEYRVVVPLTGGMDSTTCWQMAIEAGLDPEAVYVDMGQHYMGMELATVRDLLGVTPRVIDGPRPPASWKHLLPGRNAAVIFLSALTITGQWGELWLGNLAGETPAVGGDKSARFLLTAQQMLTCMGHDVHLLSPLRGLDKTDLVTWWAARGDLETLAQTKSCFHPHLRACGSCQTCFRKLVAFYAAGHADVLEWDGPVDWSEHVAKYRPVMEAAVARKDWSRYSPARCRDTLACIADLQG